MAIAFDSKSRTIAELMGAAQSAQIVVPKFQRGYSWKKKHVEDFWRDISRFRDQRDTDGGNKQYFLGPIVTLSKGDDVTQILDGQQRLATATILLSVIRDALRSIGGPQANKKAYEIQSTIIESGDDRFALVMGDIDQQFFIDCVQQMDASPPTARTSSHRNIAKAKALLQASIQHDIQALPDPRKIERLLTLLKLIRHNIVMACIPVASEEQALLIFETLNDRGLKLSVPDLLLCYLMREAQPIEQPQIRALWSDITLMIGKRETGEFMRHAWVSRHGDLKSRDLFSELKRHIGENRISGLDYARQCADDCGVYVSLLDATAELGTAAKDVRNLVVELGYASTLPLLMSACAKFPEELATVTRLLLVFVVRHSIVSGLDTDEFDTLLFRLAREVRGLSAGAECISLLRRELAALAPNDARFREDFMALQPDSSEAKYLLIAIGNKLQSESHEVALGKVNIEHIFPVSPTIEEWSNMEAMMPYVDHIGNLTLLSPNRNRSIGNRSYQHKVVKYAASEVLMTKRIGEKFTTWVPASIDIRCAELASQAVAIWNFQNTSYV